MRASGDVPGNVLYSGLIGFNDHYLIFSCCRDKALKCKPLALVHTSA